MSQKPVVQLTGHVKNACTKCWKIWWEENKYK